MDYKTSGVDIEAGREFVSEIKQAGEGTHTTNVIEGIGGFGGLFRIPIDSFKKPVLVSGTCLLYTSPSPRDGLLSRMPSSA